MAILPITIAPFAAGSLNPTLDGIFIGLILIHTHIGFEYVRQTPSRLDINFCSIDMDASSHADSIAS